jgi:Mrp family chromosome partitioning ATPase
VSVEQAAVAAHDVDADPAVTGPTGPAGDRSAHPAPGERARAPRRPLVPEQALTACRAVVRRLHESGLSDLAVTSTRRGEGRTTVALGTALVLREAGTGPVVLLELDPARPSLAEVLRLRPAPGLSEALRGTVPLEQCVSWVDSALGVLRAGDLDPDGKDVDGRDLGARLPGVLGALTAAGCRVVADLPPLPPHGPGDRLAPAFAATLLVVRAGRTPVEEVRAAARTLPSPPAVVLNATSSALPGWLRAFGY